MATLHPQETSEESRGGHPEDSADAYAGVAAVTPEDGPSPASTGKAGLQLRPLATAQQVKGATTLVEAMLAGATTLFNRKMREHRDDQRWLMSKRERETIAAPLGRILARRSPVPGGGEDVSDLADGIEALVGLLGYALDQSVSDPAPKAGAQLYVQPAAQPVQQEEAPQPAPTGPGFTPSPLDPSYRPF